MKHQLLKSVQKKNISFTNFKFKCAFRVVRMNKIEK